MKSLLLILMLEIVIQFFLNIFSLLILDQKLNLNFRLISYLYLVSYMSKLRSLTKEYFLLIYLNFGLVKTNDFIESKLLVWLKLCPKLNLLFLLKNWQLKLKVNSHSVILLNKSIFDFIVLNLNLLRGFLWWLI